MVIFIGCSSSDNTDGRYLYLAYRLEGNVWKNYSLFTFDPETKQIARFKTTPSLPDGGSVGLLQPIVDRINARAFLPGILRSAADPVQLRLYTVNLKTRALTSPTGSYSLPNGHYRGGVGLTLLQDGRVFLTGGHSQTEYNTNFSPIPRTMFAGGKASKTFSISGTARTVSRSPLPQVTMTLSGAKAAETATDDQGNYKFSGLPNGVYKITPGKDFFAFTPSSRSMNIRRKDIKRQNFVGKSVPAPPKADFSGSPLSGPAPLEVKFTDASTGSISSWAWEFGDGGISQERNPTHIYNTPGIYSVKLSVLDPAGGDVKVRADYINVIVGSVDIAAFQSSSKGAWFSVDLSTLPKTQLSPQAHFDIKDSVIKNRRNGQISPTLLSGYFFMQWDISSSFLEKYVHTIKGLFLRSNFSFVDYPNNRVLGWYRESTNIAADIRGVIKLCNKKNIPVFLEINYSNYIPGEQGTGVESLRRTDNIANTMAFLRALKAERIHLDGVTFGDQIEDESGYGAYKPTIHNSDLIGRFISYAHAIKSEFPELKIYGFASYIPATRGKVSMYWDFFKRIRQAEIEEGKPFLDGFIFTESYIYIDEKGNLLESQFILDDTESLYRDTPVYRYDVWGNSHPNPDRAYLHTIIDNTMEIFGRSIDIGLSEYLPAVPLQMGEINTSSYSDINFILHFSDIVGIYAQLGHDFVAKMMFGDHIDHHKSYFDRKGNLGTNYPVHEQLAQQFSGRILNVDRSVSYDNLKVKVYAARQDTKYFIMILNKDVKQEHTIQIALPEHQVLIVRLPRRSYTSVKIDYNNINNITISGVGN